MTSYIFHPYVCEMRAASDSSDGDNPEVYEVPPTPLLVGTQGLDGDEQLLVVFVGLPARGKTFLSTKLSRLLGWQGIRCQVVNVQVLWRAALGVSPVTADAFERLLLDNSAERSAYRKVLADYLPRAKEFFADGGRCLVINDDLVTGALRRDVCLAFANVVRRVMFIEVCRESDADLDRLKVQTVHEYPPQFVGALDDFRRRVQCLAAAYEEVSAVDSPTFVRILTPEMLTVTNATGYLPSRVVSYLLNLSQKRRLARPIYFTRHGESEDNVLNRLGGDSPLTTKGQEDAEALAHFVEKVVMSHREENASIEVWTSLLQRTQQTAALAVDRSKLPAPRRLRALNEINGGMCDGLTYEEVRERHPLIYTLRLQNKFYFRYPGGESYQDLLSRLESVIVELENTDRVVLVVAHQAVLRVLLSYFGNLPAASCTSVDVPHRTVWRCTYDSKGGTSLATTTI